MCTERLLENRREKFLSMRTDNEDIFGKDSLDFGKLGLLGHAINTSECKPVKQPPCRVPPYQWEVINQQLHELLAMGRIEQSQSSWNSPVVLATKQDGTYRMYTEHCKLNQLTKKDSIPHLRWMMCWVFRLGSRGFLALIWPPDTGRCKWNQRLGLTLPSQLIRDNSSGQYFLILRESKPSKQSQDQWM